MTTPRTRGVAHRGLRSLSTERQDRGRCQFATDDDVREIRIPDLEGAPNFGQVVVFDVMPL